MRVLEKFSPVQAAALAAVVSFGVLGTAGCGHDSSSQPPATAVTPASGNAPVAIPPPPNVQAKTPASSSAPTAMPPPSNATGQ